MSLAIAELRDEVNDLIVSKKGTDVSLKELYREFGCENDPNEQERVRRVTSELCSRGRVKKVMSGVYRAKNASDAAVQRKVNLPPLGGWLLNLIRTSRKAWSHRELLARAGQAGQSVKAVPGALRKLVAEGMLENPSRGVYCAPGATMKEVPVSAAEEEETLGAWVKRFMREKGKPVHRAELAEAAERRGNKSNALYHELYRLKKSGEVVSCGRGIYTLPDAEPDSAPEQAATPAPLQLVPASQKQVSEEGETKDGGSVLDKLEKRLAETREGLSEAKERVQQLAEELRKAEYEEGRLEQACKDLEGLIEKARNLDKEIAAALGEA